MADEDVQYEVRTVQTIRGTDARSIARWQKSGWELVDQNQGTLRTTLRFRRPKPKLPWVPVAAAAGVLVLLASVIGIGIALEGGGDGDVSGSTMPKDETTVVARESPSAAPERSTPESPSPDADQPDTGQALTVANNKEFAALLSVGDSCDESIERFADKYADRTIEFDGSIVGIANHGNYDTRYDILLGPGDNGPETVVGPAFKFEDVSILDLKLIGADQLDYMGAGDRLHLVAEVGEFNPDQCLFFLVPVSMEVR